MSGAVGSIACGTAAAQRTALSTLALFFGNLGKPDDKFRSINLSNTKFVERVWQHASCREFMLANGWVEVDGMLLFLPNDGAVDTATLAASLSAAAAAAAPPSAASAAPPASSAAKAKQEEMRRMLAKQKAAKAKIKAQIEADRQNVAARKLRDSRARERHYGARINRFEDIGVDLNAAGG